MKIKLGFVFLSGLTSLVYAAEVDRASIMTAQERDEFEAAVTKSLKSNDLRALQTKRFLSLQNLYAKVLLAQYPAAKK